MPAVNARTAAKLTGKDRSTILRAIESGRLSAQKTPRGYLIDPAELERVFGTLLTPNADAHAEHEDAYAVRAATLAKEVELLRETLDRERRIWSDTLAHERRTWDEERTFLRSLVTEQSGQIKLLTDQREQKRHSPSLSIWARLFRKNA